jgi:dienelactone hydrolase
MKEAEIKTGKITLKGNLNIPNNAKGIVVFAHGSGSSRFSPRNQFVAEKLNNAGFATLLMDLLTEDEEIIDEQTAELRFNIPMLAERMIGATKWLRKNPETNNLKIGYFGASTGAAAALIAAAEFPEVKAVVSRGGRPDLAIDYLPKVKAPTLLIVGGWDEEVIEMNKEALEKIKAEKKLEIVPKATHLFEEPGKLEKVAELAIAWFRRYLK